METVVGHFLCHFHIFEMKHNRVEFSSLCCQLKNQPRKEKYFPFFKTRAEIKQVMKILFHLLSILI